MIALLVSPRSACSGNHPCPGGQGGRRDCVQPQGPLSLEQHLVAKCCWCSRARPCSQQRAVSERCRGRGRGQSACRSGEHLVKRCPESRHFLLRAIRALPLFHTAPVHASKTWEVVDTRLGEATPVPLPPAQAPPLARQGGVLDGDQEGGCNAPRERCWR